jgi:hypothetical protein
MAILLFVLLLSGVCIHWRSRARQGFHYDRMEVELEALRRVMGETQSDSGAE